MTTSKAIAMAQDTIESAEASNKINQQLIDDSILKDPYYLAALEEDIKKNDRLCSNMRLFIEQMGKPSIFDKALYIITKN